MATTLDWPEERLGLPLLPGYGIEPQEGIARTDMDAGPARQRRRSTSPPTRFPVRFLFSALQFGLFEGWYKHRAEEGAAWFNITLLSGTGLGLHEARFMGQYKAAPASGKDRQAGAVWDVSTVLEIRERPVLSELALQVFMDSEPSVLFSTIDAFTHLVEFEFPGQTGDELLALQTIVAAFTHLVEHEFPT